MIPTTPGSFWLDAHAEIMYQIDNDGISQNVFQFTGNLNGAYTPNAGLFAGSAPTTYTQAVNRIAALLKTLAGGKQP